MAIELNIQGGEIHKGDTKTLTLTPKDADGNAVSPSVLTATFTALRDGTDGNYVLGDFAEAGGAYSVKHTFDGAGVWTISVEAKDSEGNAETDGDAIRVVDIP